MRLFWLYLRLNLMNEMQYRANFFLRLLQSLVAVVTGIIGVVVIFDHTERLSGWTQNQLLAVVGIFTIVGGVIRTFIEPNMQLLLDDIPKGNFDYVLVKPVDSQLLVSVRDFRVWNLTDVVVGGGVLVYAVLALDLSPGPLEALWFVVALLAGCFMFYCVWLTVSCAAFWVVRFDMVHDLFTGLYRSGQYPVTLYPTWLRFGLTFVIPVGFAVTVPAESLTGRATWARIGVTLAAAAVSFVASRAMWRFALRHYSGASA